MQLLAFQLVAVIVAMSIPAAVWVLSSIRRREEMARRLLLEEIQRGPANSEVLVGRIARRCGVYLNTTLLHPALQQLEMDGKVFARQEPGPQERGGKPRTVYYIPERQVSQRPPKQPSRQARLRHMPSVVTRLYCENGTPFAITRRDVEQDINVDDVPSVRRR